jgi:hypothetical protein
MVNNYPVGEYNNQLPAPIPPRNIRRAILNSDLHQYGSVAATLQEYPLGVYYPLPNQGQYQKYSNGFFDASANVSGGHPYTSDGLPIVVHDVQGIVQGAYRIACVIVFNGGGRLTTIAPTGDGSLYDNYNTDGTVQYDGDDVVFIQDSTITTSAGCNASYTTGTLTIKISDRVPTYLTDIVTAIETITNWQGNAPPYVFLDPSIDTDLDTTLAQLSYIPWQTSCLVWQMEDNRCCYELLSWATSNSSGEITVPSPPSGGIGSSGVWKQLEWLGKSQCVGNDVEFDDSNNWWHINTNGRYLIQAIVNFGNTNTEPSGDYELNGGCLWQYAVNGVYDGASQIFAHAHPQVSFAVVTASGTPDTKATITSSSAEGKAVLSMIRNLQATDNVSLYFNTTLGLMGDTDQGVFQIIRIA